MSFLKKTLSGNTTKKAKNGKSGNKGKELLPTTSMHATERDPPLFHNESDQDTEDEENEDHSCSICRDTKEGIELKCSRCRNYFCLKCSELKKNDYKLLCRRVSNVHWFCKNVQTRQEESGKMTLMWK